MRIANLAGRPQLVVDGHLADIPTASAGLYRTFSDLYDDWDDFRRWASDRNAWEGSLAVAPADAQYGAPSPSPSQIFAIGLNYRDHAEESGQPIPDAPVVFAKFASALSGPRPILELPSDTVDWEVEMVAVIGRTAHRVTRDAGWDHIAGLTVGQDYSERMVQLAGPVPQFSLGKSYRGFAAIGGFLTTPDELIERDSLDIRCDIDGQTVQSSNTRNLIFDVPALVEYLSAICTLQPGDLIFTGTPAGVGMGHDPRRFLRDGEVVTSTIDGLGQLVQTCRRAS